jgi:hypothetical protein
VVAGTRTVGAAPRVIRDATVMDVSGWVSVRCIFRSAYGEAQIFEERVTLWRASSMDEEIELAEQEAVEYAAEVCTPPAEPTEYVGLAQAYLLSDEPGSRS